MIRLEHVGMSFKYEGKEYVVTGIRGDGSYIDIVDSDGDDSFIISYIDEEDSFEWISKAIPQELPFTPKIDHTGHTIIMNSANGESFRMCKTCCVEIEEE
jgi:hypothetical protein